jgi:hypothetical protein
MAKVVRGQSSFGGAFPLNLIVENHLTFTLPKPVDSELGAHDAREANCQEPEAENGLTYSGGSRMSPPCPLGKTYENYITNS